MLPLNLPIKQILQTLPYRTSQYTVLESSSRESTLLKCHFVIPVALNTPAWFDRGKRSTCNLWQVHRSYAPKAVVLGSAAAVGPAAVPFDTLMPPAVLGADTGVHCAMLRLGWFSVKVAASAMGPLRQCIHTSAQPGQALKRTWRSPDSDLDLGTVCGILLPFQDASWLAAGGPARGNAIPSRGQPLQ